ncbi:unnamed protein product [Sphagnum jensenii]|uniref:Uncharacterized protein n=1 Tax=Sphagnum jensenii TaxID=128206 RepID=A0ABP1AFF2_9BRYO
MVLPDSFGMLTGLQKLTLDGNPWRIPPREVAQRGKELIDPSTFVHSFGSLYGEFETLMFFSVFGSQVVCLISEILTAAKNGDISLAVLEFMNNLVEQREIERARPPKTGLVSMMTVFRKKNKSKKFKVKDTWTSISRLDICSRRATLLSATGSSGDFLICSA